jgi:hypothetical protein
MTNATATFARLATEAAERADAKIYADEIFVQMFDGAGLFIFLEPGGITAMVGVTERWTWQHDTIADYIAERKATNN